MIHDLIMAAAGSTATGYNLTNSLRIRSSASAYLSRTPAGAGNQLKWTWSGWAKIGTFGGASALMQAGNATTDETMIMLNTDSIRLYNDASNTVNMNVISSAVYRDPAAWYHFVIAYDSAQATAANRVLMYVNGVQITSFATATYPAQNQTTYLNGAVGHALGQRGPGGTLPYDGLLAEVNFIDGQALAATSFGAFDATTGVWQPKRYSGTYGTNGFYLPFSDNSGLTTSSNTGLGKDFSGNGNYWTTNNISLTAGATYDSFTDVPTLTSSTAANLAVLNPIDRGPNMSLSNGNLTAVNTPTASIVRSTLGVSSGKWYWELTVGASYGHAGIANATAQIDAYLGSNANGWAYNSLNGRLYNNSSTSGTNATWSTIGDVIGFAFDASAGTLSFYKNGVLQPSSFSGIPAGTYYAAIGTSSNGTNHFNFGQRPFAYTPPSGFLPLNAYNLPTPTIQQPNKYFEATLLTGTGSPATIVNSGSMQPDLVWLKNRSSSQDHYLVDSVRGNSNLYSNLTNAENGVGNGAVTSMNSNGFTTVALTNTNNYVGWQWKKGATPGFDIVAYTGNGASRTIAHALGAAPKMMIIKSRSGANSWIVYTQAVGAGAVLQLESTNATTAASTFFNSTAPTSSVFSVGTDNSVNNNGSNYIAYLWSEVLGFSKFGSYTGNGSTDGPFVYCGFMPKYIMVKASSAVEDWVVLDASRNATNGVNAFLLPDSSSAEGTYSAGGSVDFLSNGVKFRTTGGGNAASTTYIFAAFAEAPTKYALAR